MKYFFSILIFLSTAGSLTSQSDFITKWTDITTEVSFYVVTSGNVNYTWTASPSGNSGSGSFNQSTADVLVTLTGLNVPMGDIMTLSFEPDNLLRFYNCEDAVLPFLAVSNPDGSKLSQISQWGSVVWSSMENALCNCDNFNLTAIDEPNLSVTTNLSTMFFGAVSFNEDIDDWDVSNITDMSWMFSESQFNQGLNAWDVSNVTDMSWMFSQSHFNQNIDDWDVSNVIDMSLMFSGSQFNQSINAWDVSNVTNMRLMFSGSQFNQSINDWDVSSVTIMDRMFLQSQFSQPVNNWDVSNVTDMSLMFLGSQFNQSINEWDVSNVIDMSLMFSDAINYNQVLGDLTFNSNVDLTGFLNSSGLDCDSYSTSLAGWSANPNTPNNMNLGAGGRQYGTNVVQDRDNLVNNKGWTISGDSNSGTVCNAALPVTFTSLDVVKVEASHSISFSTASEINNESFIIEHSTDGKVFRRLSIIEGKGNSTSETHYEYIHHNPSQGINYYRIKQVDFDGQYSYSRVVTAMYNKGGTIIYPNPATSNLSIEIQESGTVKIYNHLGLMVSEYQLEKGENTISISDIDNGLYMLQFSDGAIERLVKQ